MSYSVYILRCADDTLYTGIATDLDRRLTEHNSSEKGARYTRSRRPVKLVYSEPFPDRSSASRREYEIKKKMNRAQKLELIRG
ncbi:MAG: GIY-YIG nuclease family protein [Campylobacterales bacterium]|nr:GIY-YIG nuclease family protein [Campylobacterales bacterium]HEO98490.1 GIY-YIG nuclease family protein [Campylobacterota bacterium]